LEREPKEQRIAGSRQHRQDAWTGSGVHRPFQGGPFWSCWSTPRPPAASCALAGAGLSQEPRVLVQHAVGLPLPGLALAGAFTAGGQRPREGSW